MANLKKLPCQWTGKIHDRGHPLNQSRGRNMKQIRLTKILAAGLACAASLGVTLGADDNNYNDHRPRDGHDDNPTDDHQLCGKHRHLHPGLGLLHVPNDVGCGARTVLLHEGYDRGRSRRSCRKFVGGSPGHAGHCLLFNSGRSGCGAQSRLGATSAAAAVINARKRLPPLRQDRSDRVGFDKSKAPAKNLAGAFFCGT